MGNQNCVGAENVNTDEVNLAEPDENKKPQQQLKISGQITNPATNRQDIQSIDRLDPIDLIDSRNPIEGDHKVSLLIGYCDLEDHEKYQKTGFCINKQCQEKSRFVCSKCKHNSFHQYNHSKQDDILDEYQMEIRIKDNCEQLIEIYKYCYHQLDTITIKLHKYAQQLQNNINDLTKLIGLEQINQQIEQIKQIYQNNQFNVQNDQDYLLNFLVNDQKKLIENQLETVYEKFYQINDDVKQLVSSQSEIKLIQADLKKFYGQKNQDPLINSYQQISEKSLTERQKLFLPKSDKLDHLNSTKVANYKDQTTTSLEKPKQSDQSREELYDQFYKATMLEKPSIKFKIGQSYYRSRQYERALQEFQEILQTENQQNFYEFFFYFGKCQLKILEQSNFKDQKQKTENLRKILGNFKKSFKLNYQFLKIYPKLCQIYLMLRENKNAAEIINRGYKLDQDNAKIIYYYGKIQQIEGNFNIALKYFHQCLNIKPENQQALYEIALIEYNNGHYEQIFDHLNKIISKKPSNPEPYLLQSKAFWKTGNIHQSLQLIDDGRNKFPFDTRFIDRKKKLIKDLELKNPDAQLQEIDEIILLAKLITKLNKKKIQNKQKNS